MCTLCAVVYYKIIIISAGSITSAYNQNIDRLATTSKTFSYKFYFPENVKFLHFKNLMLYGLMIA